MLIFKSYPSDKLGAGGFGTIYFCSSKKASKEKEYAVKIEPKDSGPLFCEMHFYNNCTKKAKLDLWLKSNKSCKHLGVPEYVAHGHLDYKKSELRFLVMPFFKGGDFQKYINDQKDKQVPRNILARISIQTIWSLKYIHSCSYAHADIKGMNILLDKSISNKNDFKSYLVDFGLANRFSNNRVHKPDPKKAGDGTIEYTSLDAHVGASPSPRGDFEILLYCLVHWATGTLPWWSDLEDKDKVMKKKQEAMKSSKKFIETCWKNRSDKVWPELLEFGKVVEKMEYEDDPDHEKLLKFFEKAEKSKSQVKKVLSESSQDNSPVATPRRSRRRAAVAKKKIDISRTELSKY